MKGKEGSEGMRKKAKEMKGEGSGGSEMRGGGVEGSKPRRRLRRCLLQRLNVDLRSDIDY